MFEVIKGSSPVNTIVVEGDVKIAISSLAKDSKEKPEDSEKEETEKEQEEADSGLIKMTQEELDDLRAQYRMDGEHYAEEMRVKSGMEFARAKSQADKIVEDAENKAHEILASAEEKVSLAAEEGRKQGYEAGYQEGRGKGAEDGYTQSMRDCRGAVQELQNLCQSIEKEKSELMTENRRAIFDLSMGIAQKITLTMLSQKDKSVLQKMITNAAKDFRKSKRVKVTVSRLDLSDDVETDLKVFEKCFAPGAEVEFEVLEDGERGTLQIENDTEILDAGVSTQLKMIEELGSGKYRDKEAEPAEKQEPKAPDKAEVKTSDKAEAKASEKSETKSSSKKAAKNSDTDNEKALAASDEDAEQ